MRRLLHAIAPKGRGRRRPVRPQIECRWYRGPRVGHANAGSNQSGLHLDERRLRIAARIFRQWRGVARKILVLSQNDF